MKYEAHLSDQQLLLEVEGELSARDEKMVREHLDECWQCRARRQEFDQAITDFTRAYQREFVGKLPPTPGPRAKLKAQLAELAGAAPSRHSIWMQLFRGLAFLSLVSALLVGGFVLTRLSFRRQTDNSEIFSIPDPRLTPGATVLASRPAVCAQPNIKNKAVPVALQRQVFEEYGIAGADPRMYEVDYLVTPALGGADDIHNLWPHSYSATVWNAQVKDALEDRLRELVCSGEMDLSEAQREIAANWIVAYQKYFHTDKPLAEHCAECAQ